MTVSPGKALLPRPLDKYLALKNNLQWEKVLADCGSHLPVHFQQLHVCVSPLNEGYIILEIVTRACYDAHEVEKGSTYSKRRFLLCKNKVRSWSLQSSIFSFISANMPVVKTGVVSVAC